VTFLYNITVSYPATSGPLSAPIGKSESRDLDSYGSDCGYLGE